MSDVVADSSVVAKWVIPKPDSVQAHRLYSEVVASGGRLIVLDIALVEVANALWKRQHRGLAMSSETDRLLDDLLTLSVHVEPALPRPPRLGPAEVGRDGPREFEGIRKGLPLATAGAVW